MGYTLKIGEAVISDNGEDLDCTPYITVADLEIQSAPLNSNNDRSNCILPSYSGWFDFAQDTGLQAVFWGDDSWTDKAAGLWQSGGVEYSPLMPEHPGVARLRPAHLAAFIHARKDLRHGDLDTTRLDWLIWWTEYALRECKCPVLVNS